MAKTKSKNLTGYDLLNKLHEKVSPNSSKIETNLSRFKYYEPDLDVKAKGSNSINESINKTDDSEIDVISLLREARNKSNLSISQNKTIDFEDDDDVIELNSSSLIMDEDVNLRGSVLTYGKKESFDDGAWDDNDLYSESGNQVDGYKSPVSKTVDEVNNDPEDQIDKDEYCSQESLGDLADLLGSDVEVI